MHYSTAYVFWRLRRLVGMQGRSPVEATKKYYGTCGVSDELASFRGWFDFGLTFERSFRTILYCFVLF